MNEIPGGTEKPAGKPEEVRSGKPEAGRKNPDSRQNDRLPGMKVNSAELETVCGITSSFPVHTEAEFTFAGRSNVGKSSLINALMQRKALARTSSTPGKTQTVNYYKVNDDFYFVDLPGYGFTKASPSVREKWGKMVERYLKRSSTIRILFLLVDIRHRPTEDDCLMFDWVLSNGYRPVVIATKLDKLKKNEIPKALRLIRETLSMEPEDRLIPFSAETKKGREEIYSLIRECLGQQESLQEAEAKDREKG